MFYSFYPRTDLRDKTKTLKNIFGSTGDHMLGKGTTTDLQPQFLNIFFCENGAGEGILLYCPG